MTEELAGGATLVAVLKSDRYARTLRVRLPDGTAAVHKTSVYTMVILRQKI